MLLITGFQNGMRAAPWSLRSCALWLPRSSVHHPNQVFDWTSVLFAFPLVHCWILPSVESSCVVPKNLAGLSTHAVPGSPLTFLLKSPTNLVEISIKGEVVAPPHQRDRRMVARIKWASTHDPLPSQSTRRIISCPILNYTYHWFCIRLLCFHISGRPASFRLSKSLLLFLNR